MRITSVARLLFPGICCLVVPLVSETRFVPLFNSDLAIGNSWFEGEPSSLGANLGFDFAPIVRFSETSVLIPRLLYRYQGVRTALQIADKGNLYQQYQDYLAAVKYVHGFGDGALRGRAEVGYKTELTRETENETWSKGLYDYTNPYLEVSVERRFTAAQVGAGYRRSGFAYYNYSTVGSIPGVLSTSTVINGTNTFNNTMDRVYLHAGFSLQRTERRSTFLDMDFVYDAISYTDNRVWTGYNQVSDQMRRDGVFTLGTRIVTTAFGSRRDTTLGLRLDVTAKNSNQNEIEGTTYAFIEGYYNYNRLTLQPYMSVRFHPRELTLDFAWQLAGTTYTERMAQDVDGIPTDEKAQIRSSVLSVAATYPFGERWKAVLSAMFRGDSSNIAYEQNYRYNFNSSNVMVSVFYEL
jgi:hypothetical protein